MSSSIAERIAEALVVQTESKKLDMAVVKAELASLADDVTIDSVDASSEAITLGADNSFSGEGVVYMSLGHGNMIIGEELPLRFGGHVSANGDVTFDSIHADLSPLDGGS